jgi:hypothetical protein
MKNTGGRPPKPPGEKVIRIQLTVKPHVKRKILARGGSKYVTRLVEQDP